MSFVPTGTRNFLIPANGNTNAVKTEGVATSQVEYIRWADFSVDNFKFYPQGAYVDNSAGTADLVLNIKPIGYVIRIAAGATRAISYPAPSQYQIIEITGTGAYSIIWVDYPVFPDNPIGGPGSAPIDVRIDPATLPLATTGTPLSSAATPYQTTNLPFVNSGGSVTFALDVTDTASAEQTVAAGLSTVRIANAGEDPVLVVLSATDTIPTPVFPGTGTDEAGIVMLPGTVEVFANPAGTGEFYWRAICAASGTTTLYVVAGTGT